MLVNGSHLLRRVHCPERRKWSGYCEPKDKIFTELDYLSLHSSLERRATRKEDRDRMHSRNILIGFNVNILYLYIGR